MRGAGHPGGGVRVLRPEKGGSPGNDGEEQAAQTVAGIASLPVTGTTQWDLDLSESSGDEGWWLIVPSDLILSDVCAYLTNYPILSH